MTNQRKTGKWLFQKGHVAWNKGKQYSLWTDAQKKSMVYQRGRPKPKPANFADTMRRVNPPIGRKICGGYVLIYKPDYPNSRKTPPNYGYITEHRYVMEQHLGRTIYQNGTKGEQIHHLDGDKSNNALSNLVLCSSVAEHHYLHDAMEKLVCGMIKTGEIVYDHHTKTFVRHSH